MCENNPRNMIFLIIFGIISTCLAAPHLNIEGGDDAAPGQFPFLVSMESCVFGICQHVCGGVIINNQWILTTGWCAPSVDRLVVGAVKLNDKNPEKQSFGVKKSFSHPEYDGGFTSPYDIALLKVDGTLNFNLLVQPAELPAQGAVPDGTAELISYADSLWPDGNVQKVAQNLNVITYEECHEALDKVLDSQIENPLNSTSNLCTGPWGGRSITCEGDSGSPLSQNETVIGIVTWYLSPCGYPKGPNIFTNVALFVDWINQTVQDNQYL